MKEYTKKEIDRILKFNKDIKSSFNSLIFSLSKISNLISFNFNIEDVLEILLNTTEEFIHCKGSILFIYKNGDYKIKLKRNVTKNLQDVLFSHSKEGLFEWAVKNKKPVVLPEERLKGVAIIVPLIFYDEVMGVLDIFTDEKEENITDEDIKLLSIISAQGAIAIKNAFLYNEMKDTNIKIENMRAYMSDVIENLNDAIIVVDLNKTIKAFNKSAENLFFIPKEKAINNKISDVFNEYISQNINSIYEDTLEKGQVSDREINNKIEDKNIPISINTTIFSSKENPGIIYTCKDISESKEIKRLKEIDKMKSELVSNVSHELKTPLSSITAYTETLIDIIDENDKETKLEFLNIISQEANRLTQFINDLLDISAIEAKKVLIKKEKFDVYDIINKCCTIVKKLSEEKNVIIINKIVPKECILKADKNKIFRIFLNLITNSVKYNINKGKVKIFIKKLKKKISIIFEDSGIGIDKENLDKIFEQFYRVDNSLTAEIGGTGLGLSIVKNIIDIHGWKISVKSKSGKGTKFIVDIPGEECEY